MMATPGSVEALRNANLTMVLRLVHELGPLRRAELTSSTGLSRSTVKGLVDDLVDAGLVTERRGDSEHTYSGRPSLEVHAVAEGAGVIAADLGVDSTKVAHIGLGGAVLERRRHRNPVHDPAPEAVARAMAAQIDDLVTAAHAAGRQVSALGVALPGVVRGADGLITVAPNLGWHDVPFGELLRGYLSDTIPVVFGNDGALGARAEWVRGSGRGADSLLYVAGEFGVGGGVVGTARRLSTGAEVGHLLVNPTGRVCRCGGRGCWETEIGGEAILLACGQSPSAGPDGLAEVLRLATAGDRATIEGLEHVSTWAARGLASLANLFDPEIVILGGTLAAVYSRMYDVVSAQVQPMARMTSRGEVRLMSPGLGEDSGLLGAAEAAFDLVLDSPRTMMSVTGPALVVA